MNYGYKYKALRRKEAKCIKCHVCETMLSGFITEHDGEILIEPEQYEKESTQKAIDDVVNACLGDAIQPITIVDTNIY